MRFSRFPYLLVALFVNFIAFSFTPIANAASQETLKLILLAVDKRCDELVTEVNKGVADGRPNILLYAGDIHEYGNCVDRDWEKATMFYQKAARAGSTIALHRLIALYAVERHDPAAALWWAAQNRGMLPKDCLPVADPVKNATGFLDELRSWPSIKLDACTYHAGVMSRLLVKILEFSIPGQADEIVVEAEINLSTGSIDWFLENEKKIAISSTAERHTNFDLSGRLEDLTISRLGTDATRTLREFGRPPSTDPRWTERKTFSVDQIILPSRIPIQIQVAQ